MLHIINGESSAGTLRHSGIEGKKFTFRDALIFGPTPAHIQGDEWHRIRARHLSESYGVDFESCVKGLIEQDEVLRDFDAHDEVVLWFEHDLFCQVNLLYLLDWFGGVPLKQTRLSLIDVGAFPGKPNFRGLGELNPDELTSLFPTRQPVTRTELDLAASAWQAYCSADPTTVEGLLAKDTTPLPFLKAAMRAHLERFPSVENGLGRIEEKGLELIDQGLHRFAELFPKFGDSERVYGLGDSQFLIKIKQLSDVSNPLVSANSDINLALDADAAQRMEFKITETGRAVLRREADFVRLNGIDHWLGGVHLAGRDSLWRWDTFAERLVAAA